MTEIVDEFVEERRKKNRLASRKWYKENKKKLSKARKAKYAKDPTYRTKVLAANREFKISKPRNASPDGKVYRLIGDKKVEVFRIGPVAEEINRNQQALRIWEKKGIIPKPTIPGGHRFYTQKQVELLKEFAEAMDQYRYNPAEREEKMHKMKCYVLAHWKD